MKGIGIKIFQKTHFLHLFPYIVDLELPPIVLDWLKMHIFSQKIIRKKRPSYFCVSEGVWKRLYQPKCLFFNPSWDITVTGISSEWAKGQKVTKRDRKLSAGAVRAPAFCFSLSWDCVPTTSFTTFVVIWVNFVPEARWGVAKHLKQVYGCLWTSFRPCRFACQNWNPRPACADR